MSDGVGGLYVCVLAAHQVFPTLHSLTIPFQVIYIGGAVMSLFLDGELALPVCSLVKAAAVLKGDKRGRSLKAAPLSGCWRRLLIGKMQIFFDQEKD